jgi:hypothetical protein
MNCRIQIPLLAVVIFGIGISCRGDAGDGLDQAVQNLVRLATDASGTEKSAPAAVAQPSAPSATPQAAASPSAVAPEKTGLSEDFWGADQEDGAFDLKFNTDNGKDDKGTVQIYIRSFRSGTRVVDFDSVSRANWTSENQGGTMHIKIDAAAEGQANYSLDKKQDGTRLILNSGSGIFSNNVNLNLLVKRPLSATEMGRNGKHTFAK